MEFKAKLRRIGNSFGVIIPREVITSYKEGEDITLDVITDKGDNTRDVITKSLLEEEKVITKPIPEEKVITEKKGLMFNLKKGVYERK